MDEAKRRVPRIPYTNNPPDIVRAVDLALMVLGEHPEVVAYRRGVLDGIDMTVKAFRDRMGSSP